MCQWYCRESSRSNNYRPITLLSVVGKVLEKNCLRKALSFCKFTPVRQSVRIRRKDSTSHQLTRLVQEWSQTLDKAQHVRTCVFDLRKAFDKCGTRGSVLIKLEFAGIKHHAVAWLRNITCLTVNIVSRSLPSSALIFSSFFCSHFSSVYTLLFPLLLFVCLLFHYCALSIKLFQ